VNTLKLILCVLAVVTSLGCTILLIRGYVRRRVRLLGWSAICFGCLTINNIALILDSFVFADVDLRPVRLAAALVGMLFLIYGFIWDSE